MPKPVGMAAAKKKTTTRPSSDPNTRAKPMPDEPMGKLSQGKWADVPVPEPGEPFPSALSGYMRSIGSKGGKISGLKRMDMPAKKRIAIAKKAAAARWGKKAPAKS